MSGPLVECVPNFSEGRDTARISRIEAAIASSSGVAVLGRHADPDHNRCVITFAGPPEAVLEGALRGVEQAVALIDLNRHQGVHPRIGAADVVPFAPLAGIALEECVALAHRAGAEIWRRFRVPVYYYEAAAKRPERARLEYVRRGQFEALREQVQFEDQRRPDVGENRLHPTAGAVAVGARKLLIAFNVALRTADLAPAKEIAKAIRASSGGLPHVKALGLPLGSRGLVQVSINLTDYEATPLEAVYEAVCREAERRGVAVAGIEIVGFVPRKVREAAAARFPRGLDCPPEAILENRLRDLFGPHVRME